MGELGNCRPWAMDCDGALSVVALLRDWWNWPCSCQTGAQQIQPEFGGVVWRSLQNARRLKMVRNSATYLATVTGEDIAVPSSLDGETTEGS